MAQNMVTSSCAKAGRILRIVRMRTPFCADLDCDGRDEAFTYAFGEFRIQVRNCRYEKEKNRT